MMLLLLLRCLAGTRVSSTSARHAARTTLRRAPAVTPPALLGVCFCVYIASV